MSYEWCLGVDLSLTGTGLALVRDGVIKTGLVSSKGAKSAGLADRYRRLMDLTDRVVWNATIPQDGLGLVAVEQPSYGSMTGSHHDRSGLWWLVVSEFMANNIPVAEVPPATLKKYVTGKGNAGKDEMIASSVRRHPTADIQNNNVADAVGLASMGARWAGFPVDDLPKRNLETLDKVRWPE